MENQSENFNIEKHRFDIRAKIQERLIYDSYKLKDPNFKGFNDLTNAEANKRHGDWIIPNSALFDEVFTVAVREHPSFWDDVERDFDGAVELIKQKLLNQEAEKIEKIAA